jgi:hypothetical protein
MKFKDGVTYEGEWRLNKFHGFGILSYPNQDYFKGNFVAGEKHGNG